MSTRETENRAPGARAKREAKAEPTATRHIRRERSKRQQEAEKKRRSGACGTDRGSSFFFPLLLFLWRHVSAADSTPSTHAYPRSMPMAPGYSFEASAIVRTESKVADFRTWPGRKLSARGHIKKKKSLTANVTVTSVTQTVGQKWRATRTRCARPSPRGCFLLDPAFMLTPCPPVLFVRAPENAAAERAPQPYPPFYAINKQMARGEISSLSTPFLPGGL
jgi:hypothetical protein